MTVGTGIAIAGVWIFAGMLGISRRVTSSGLVIGMVIAAIVTVILA